MKSIWYLTVILCLIVPFPATAAPHPAAATQTPCNESAGTVFCRFEREGVTVVVPKQASGISVSVVQLPLGGPSPTPGRDDIQQLVRRVINFEIRNARTGTLVSTLKPPFDLRVGYTSHDFNAAHGGLVLAFWHEKQRRWVAFRNQGQCGCTGYQLVQQQGGTGFAIVRVFRWGDPNVGWGE